MMQIPFRGPEQITRKHQRAFELLHLRVCLYRRPFRQVLHYAAAFHPLCCGQQNDAFSAADEIAGYGHGRALVRYFASLGDYFGD